MSPQFRLQILQWKSLHSHFHIDPRLFSDSTIAKNLLTYSAEIPLVEGLEKLLAWYKTTYSDIELMNLTKTDIDKNWVASSSSNPQIK